MAACSLFVSLDDLQVADGSAPGPDGGGVDAPADVAIDSASDAGPTDAGPDTGFFADDFGRADDDVVGNGWIEKNPAAYVLTAGSLARSSERSVNYPDNLVYRPASENVADTEISAEFEFAADAGGYPQVHARAQTDTITQSDFVDSYLLYVESASTGDLARTRGNESLSDLQSMALTQTLVPGETYRYRLRVVGAHPVHLTGYIEVKAGTTWTIIGFAAVDDDDPLQLADAGSVAVSGSNDDVGYAYDNFTRTNL